MLLLLVFLVPTVVFTGIWLATRGNYNSDGYGFLAVCFGVVLGLIVLVIPISKMSTYGEIEQFKSVRATVEAARTNENISQIELAALQAEIVEATTWLRETQFYAKHPWVGMFTPKCVLDLEPIK